jgi:hypothetical protein
VVETENRAAIGLANSGDMINPAAASANRSRRAHRTHYVTARRRKLL